MSFGGGGSGSNTGSGTTTTQPYAPAEPALGQILSEASTIYGQGPSAAGYVAPTTQTMQGLSAQEQIANAANQQILGTIQGQYSNPFLSPLISQAASDVYSNVAGQFSGAGRTPTSPMAQQAVTSQVAEKALPYAFGQLERERARQLSNSSTSTKFNCSWWSFRRYSKTTTNGTSNGVATILQYCCTYSIWIAYTTINISST